MSRMLRIRNWSKYQHYKDRNPPWIKIHGEILASEDWVSLPDASKLLMLVCMIVAAKHDGCVPDNPNYIKRVCYLDALPDLQPLISCGFLEKLLADASTVHANARPEKETQVRDREEQNQVSDLTSDPLPISPKSPSKPKAAKAAYSSQFEEFWKAYPTDKNMSKLMAYRAWEKLSDQDRRDAIAAVSGYKTWISKQHNYRTLHAIRFLSQRRFEGFSVVPVTTDPEVAKSREWFEKNYRKAEALQ